MRMRAARLQPRDAGTERHQNPQPPPSPQDRTAEPAPRYGNHFMNATQLDEPLILETLRQVVDPEIDCNIVDLGLIYGSRIEGRKVNVQMTLTTQGCPMHESIAWGVKNALLSLEEVEDAAVDRKSV